MPIATRACSSPTPPTPSWGSSRSWSENDKAHPTAADLIAWTQTILLDAALAKAEPKLLRYRLLHTAARIVRRGRRTVIKIATGWPWADQLAAAFTRLAAIRQPLLA